MEHHKLRSYKTWVNQSGNTVVLIAGEKVYLEMLIDIYPYHHYSHIWQDKFQGFDWGVYVNGLKVEDKTQIDSILDLFSEVIFVDDNAKQTFALDYHMNPEYYGAGRTEIGEWVYQAKYQQNLACAIELSQKFYQFVLKHPDYLKSETFIAVPYFGTKELDLPTYIANFLCQQLKLTSLQNCVCKTRSTKQMKNLKSEEEKFENIRGAFQVTTPELVKGKTITIIDDLYRSGVTLNELILVLEQAGAKVQCLVATKTMRD